MQTATSFEPGAPTRSGTIPLSVPEIRGNEAKYLSECVSSGWVSSVGPFVDRFEQQVANYIGARCAVAMVNGTSALHIALLLAGVKPDDEVLVSDLTFIAPANAIRYANAWPVFIGARRDDWQIDANIVRGFLENECVAKSSALFNKRTNHRIGAIIAVHILGHPADLDALSEKARLFGIPLIEDCAEAIGAEYKNRRVGTFGLCSTFSFNGNKVITCGGGGMLVTNDDTLADRAKYLSTQAKDDPLEYVHENIGYNYRLTNLQAAMGCAQLEQLDDFLAIKADVARRYREGLADVPGVSLMPVAPWAKSIFWLNTILIDEAVFGRSSRELLRELEAQRIQSRPLWQPMHLSAAHRGAQSVSCDISEQLYNQALSLPSSVGLPAGDQQRVIEIIRHAAR